MIALLEPQNSAINFGPQRDWYSRAALTNPTVEESKMADTRLCSIDGCGKRVNSRGWCKAHYVRFLRHGDPLGGVHHLAGVAWLEAHVHHNDDECLIWPFGKDGRGYGKVTHSFSRRANRVMCMLAHGEPPEGRPDSAHSCGVPSCVNPRHLRWASESENMMDRVAHGTANRGERHGCSKLTADDVRKIKSLSGSASSFSVAVRFGVGQEAIQKIWRGERWAWL